MRFRRATRGLFLPMAMHQLTVAGAALNQLPLDWRGNRARIAEAIRQARRAGVGVLCLPELCLSGYGCEDAFHGEGVAEQALASLRLLLPETEGMAVAVGLPFIHEQQLFNVAALLVDGRVAGLAAKRVLAGYGVYYEPRWFKAWPAGVARTTRLDGRRDGQEVPIGDLLFDLDGVRLRFEICEDAWARSQIGTGALDHQADLLLNPSASHFAFDKYQTLKGIVAEGSRLSHAVYLFSNHLGNESGRLIFDGTVLIAADGRIVAENRRFSFQEVNLVAATVDLRAQRLERRRLSYPVSFSDDVQRRTVAVPFRWAHGLRREHRAASPSVGVWRGIASAARALWSNPESNPAPHLPPPGAPEPSPQEPAPCVHARPEPSRYEQFAAAVSLGLWDYLRKSRSRGFALSLSGGVDSSSVAVLCALMAQRALAELGPEGVSRALAHVEGLPAPEAGEAAPEAARRLLAHLLLTAYQGTPNSSAETRAAARAVAGHLGARHVEIEVGSLVEAYERLAEGVIGRPLDWARDDLARQNIQARVRSPGIWLLANLHGLLLLSTSNRSEAGAGYATMDGDMSGGLAPIAGANKTFLRGWLRWVQAGGLPVLGPLPALEAVNRQAPTAELRPLAAGQQDERDLMPYTVLDAIEQAAIRDRLAPVEVWRRVCTLRFPDAALTPRELAACVARFFGLWSRTQWKRERMAPSFHLDDENLDPRTWCRFPILSAGYELELEELREAVEAEAG